ncbi:hypothetical protein AgCh_005219 [Apium graveolens]
MGQPSTIKSPKANMTFQPKRNYPKNSEKNPLDLTYETLKPDEKKLLGRSIAFFKDPRDSVLKKRIAKIHNAKNQAKKPATTDPVVPTVIAETHIEEKQAEPKQIKKMRYKIKPKRMLDFDEDRDEYMPTQSTTSNQTTMPTMEQGEFKVYLDKNFHGETIIP